MSERERIAELNFLEGWWVDKAAWSSGRLRLRARWNVRDIRRKIAKIGAERLGVAC